MKKRLIQIAGAGAVWIISAAIAFGQAGLGKGRPTGTVTDDSGNPIVAAKVILRLVRGPESKRVYASNITKSESASFETKTDAKGRWSYNGLATGIWEITASAKGYFPASRKCSVFQLQDNVRVPLQLEKAPEPVTEDPAEFALLEKGNELFYLKKFDEAIACYEIYLKAHPEFQMVALSIASCYQEKGDLDNAIRKFRQVGAKTAKDPRDKVLTARALAGIAECAYKKGDLDQAEGFFKRSIDLFPEDEVVAYNLGEICFSRQRIDEAIRYYSLAAKASPDWSDPYYKLGNACLNKADYKKAKEAFQKFLKLEPAGARAADVKKILKDIEKIRTSQREDVDGVRNQEKYCFRALSARKVTHLLGFPISSISTWNLPL